MRYTKDSHAQKLHKSFDQLKCLRKSAAQMKKRARRVERAKLRQQTQHLDLL